MNVNRLRAQLIATAGDGVRCTDGSAIVRMFDTWADEL